MPDGQRPPCFFTAKGISHGLRRDQDDRALNVDDLHPSIIRALEIKLWEQSVIDEKMPESFFSSGVIAEAVLDRLRLKDRRSSLNIQQDENDATTTPNSTSSNTSSKSSKSNARIRDKDGFLSRGNKVALAGVMDGFGGPYVASWLSKNLEYGVARYLSLLGFPQSEAVMRCVFLHAEEVIRKMREAKYFGSTCTLVMGVSTEKSSPKSAKDAANAGAAASSPQDIDLKLVVGHLGEGLALTIHRNGSLREVTEAHTPLHEAERLRVERAGGAALIRTKPGGSCLKPTEIVDHSFPPTFQPGRLGVSRCLGGMKAKMSFDPPFVLSEPEVFTIDITRSTSNADRSAAGTSSSGSSGSSASSASSDAASDIYGCMVISDGVYSYKGARLNASKLESLVKPIITGMNTKLDALSDDGGARSLFATAAADIKDTVIKAATQAQVKIGEGDNISVAVLMVADR